MKILLFQSYLRKGGLKVYPLGLVSLASCVNNHEVRICDLNLYEKPFQTLGKELLQNLKNPATVKGIYYRKNGFVQFAGARKLPNLNNLPPYRQAMLICRFTPP
jgi:hypothetical protein